MFSQQLCQFFRAGAPIGGADRFLGSEHFVCTWLAPYFSRWGFWWWWWWCRWCWSGCRHLVAQRGFRAYAACLWALKYLRSRRSANVGGGDRMEFGELGARWVICWRTQYHSCIFAGVEQSNAIRAPMNGGQMGGGGGCHILIGASVRRRTCCGMVEWDGFELARACCCGTRLQRWICGCGLVGGRADGRGAVDWLMDMRTRVVR